MLNSLILWITFIFDTWQIRKWYSTAKGFIDNAVSENNGKEETDLVTPTIRTSMYNCIFSTLVSPHIFFHSSRRTGTQLSNIAKAIQASSVQVNVSGAKVSNYMVRNIISVSALETHTHHTHTPHTHTHMCSWRITGGFLHNQCRNILTAVIRYNKCLKICLSVS